MANRIVSAILVLSFVAVCFSYQGNATQTKAKPDDKERVLVKMAVQIPTPKEDEVVVVFASGDFVAARMDQIVTIPAEERFRAIVGERSSFTFVEKGTTSGNNFWKVTSR